MSDYDGEQKHPLLEGVLAKIAKDRRYKTISFGDQQCHYYGYADIISRGQGGFDLIFDGGAACEGFRIEDRVEMKPEDWVAAVRSELEHRYY